MDPYTLAKSRWRGCSWTRQKYGASDCRCCWGTHKKPRRFLRNLVKNELRADHQTATACYPLIAEAFIGHRFILHVDYNVENIGFSPGCITPCTTFSDYGSDDEVLAMPGTSNPPFLGKDMCISVEADWEVVLAPILDETWVEIEVDL